jgi:hypothetical protein
MISMRSSPLTILLGSSLLVIAILFILSIPADAETGSVTVSPGNEDGYEEYLGPMSDPMNYWRIHYDWTIISGDSSQVRFAITDFHGGNYGGSTGESSGEGYVQVTEGSYYFSWTNNGYSDVTIEYDIWYEEASPTDDYVDPLSDDSADVACCGGMIAAGGLALLGSFIAVRSRKKE